MRLLLAFLLFCLMGVIGAFGIGLMVAPVSAFGPLAPIIDHVGEPRRLAGAVVAIISLTIAASVPVIEWRS